MPAGPIGLPELTATVPTLPSTAVALTPAYLGDPPLGRRFRVQFVDDFAEEEPARTFTATRDARDGRWRVDGVDRWTYETSELVIGAPTGEPIVHADDQLTDRQTR